jgi:hypothetical protein
LKHSTEFNSVNSAFVQTFWTCEEAFSRGVVVPEPGRPVNLLLPNNSVIACSVENIGSAQKNNIWIYKDLDLEGVCTK